MTGRKRLSGAQYRSLAKDKRKREEDALRKVPRLDVFIKSTPRSSCQEETPSPSEAVEDYGETSTPNKSKDEKKLLSNESEGGTSIVADEPFTISADPFLWEKTDKTRDYIAMNGVKQNKEGDFSKSKHQFTDGATRRCTSAFFQRKLANNEIINRDYLVYSESQGTLFCAPCTLFGGTSDLAGPRGFSNWKHPELIATHENSSRHRDCVLSLKNRSSILTRIDGKLFSQLENEVQYWRNVLQRVVAVVKKLSSRGLPFRGNDEILGSVHNGNFLMCMELIAEFDPFLASHMSLYKDSGSGKTSYLSFAIYEQIIKIMGKRVVEEIVAQVTAAKYYSIIVDSSPDIAHNDQLSFVLRYVNKEGLAEERFVEFVPNPGHGGQDLSNAVINCLERHGLDIGNCRGQSYDNAPNMSGIYSGLQARIRALSPYAFYIPCSAHTLNLVGSSAARCNQATYFFDILQEIFNFFSASSHRWNHLSTFFSKENLSVKSLCITRWSAREEACRSLNKDGEAIVRALLSIIGNESEKSLVKSEAKGIMKKLCSLETSFMTVVWNSILERFNVVSKQLQTADMDVATVCNLYSSLVGFLEEMKMGYEVFKNLGQKKFESLCNITTIDQDKKRIKKKKRFFDESDSDSEGNDDSDDLQMSFLLILDKLIEELNNRVSSYKEFSEPFMFLTNLKMLSPLEIQEASSRLQKVYSSDLEDSAFVLECLHFKSYIEKNENASHSLTQLCKMLKGNCLESVYPNLNIALQIYLSTPASNCSTERSFSALRRINNYLRTSQVKDRLSYLGVLAIESDLTVKMDYDELINLFANDRARRKPLVI